MAEKELALILRIKDLASEQLGRSLKDMEGQFRKTTDLSLSSFAAWAGAAAGAALSFGKLKDFVESSIQAGIEAERVQRQLNAAIAAATSMPLEYAAVMDAATEATLQFTTADDEAIKSAERLFLSVGNIMPSDMPRVLRATADLAATLGISFEDAAMKLAKASEGSTKEFSKLGIKFKEGATDGEKFAQVLDFIERKMTGQAQAQMDSYAGKIERMSRAWKEFKKATGQGFMESTAGQGLANFLDANAKQMEALSTIRAAQGPEAAFRAQFEGDMSEEERAKRILELAAKIRGENEKTAAEKAKVLDSEKKLNDLLASIDAHTSSFLKHSEEEAKKAAEAYEKYRQSVMDTWMAPAKTADRGLSVQDVTGGPTSRALGDVQAAALADAAMKNREQMQGIFSESVADAMPGDSISRAEEQRAQLEEQQRLLEASLRSELDTRIAAGEERVAVEDEINAQILASRQQLAGASKALDQEIYLTKVEQGAEVARIAVAALGTLFGKSKQAAIAEAIINTYLGATKALAQGGIYGAVLAAAVIAQGMAQVKQIQAQKFAAGGMVRGSGGGDTVSAMMTPGEFVLTRPQTQAIMDGRAAIVPAGGSGGYGSGGARVLNITQNHTWNMTDGDSLRRLLENNPDALMYGIRRAAELGRI